jgi:hypothetical protein
MRRRWVTKCIDPTQHRLFLSMRGWRLPVASGGWRFQPKFGIAVWDKIGIQETQERSLDFMFFNGLTGNFANSILSRSTSHSRPNL